MDFFTKAFESMDEAARESFYRTVFLCDRSAYAAELRTEYYRTQLRSMGENVRIKLHFGTNVCRRVNSLNYVVVRLVAISGSF